MDTNSNAERPTPETDAEHARKMGPAALFERMEHARRLERERDEARSDADRFIERCNELLSQRDMAHAANNEAREPRDRLAEALPIAMARAYAGGYQHGYEDTVEAQFIPVHHTDTKDYFAENVAQMLIDGSQPEAASALAAVKKEIP